MSVWEFMATVAWPVAIVVVAVLYRPLLTSLLNGGLRSVRAGPFELAWEQTRSATGSPADMERPQSATPRSISSLTPPRIGSLIDTDPRQAILEMYEVVRRGLRRGLAEAGVDPDEEADALELCREGERAGLFPPRVTDAVMGLNVLRNLALHAPGGEQLRPERAREYVAMAEGALYAAAIALAQGQRSGQAQESKPIPHAA